MRRAVVTILFLALHTNVAVAAAPRDDFASRVVDLTNAERQQAGLAQAG